MQVEKSFVFGLLEDECIEESEYPRQHWLENHTREFG